MSRTGTIERRWMLSGAVALAAISALLLVADDMSPIVPYPLHLLLLAWTISYGFVFVLPVIYLVEFGALSRIANFGKIVLYSALFLAVLSILYFWGSWEYGIKWQGESHTKIVAAENIIGFVGLVTLAFYGLKRESMNLQYSANLLNSRPYNRNASPRRFWLNLMPAWQVNTMPAKSGNFAIKIMRCATLTSTGWAVRPYRPPQLWALTAFPASRIDYNYNVVILSL